MAEEDSSSTALVRKRTDTELMPPPPPQKKIKRPKTVLDEDTYADGLSKIIARDFFPGLVESETQNEYLDALDSKDEAWISSAGQRLREAMTPGRRRRRQHTPASATLRGASVGPGETPRSFAGDTPSSVRTESVAGDDSEGSKKKKETVNTDVSLGTFQAKYTSEDNESFYKLLDKQNQKRAEKHAWLWNGNKLPSKMQLKQKEVVDQLRAAGHRLVDDGFQKDGRLAIQDLRDKNKNGGDRPAAPDAWAFSAKSALMFHPEGVEDTLETTAQRAQAESRAPPKSVVYANTRLPGTSLVSLSEQETTERPKVPPSPSLSAVRDALAGRPRRQDRDSTFGSTVTGGETPRVNGYAFVDDEEPVAETTSEPIVQFGRVDATPNPFQLPAQSRREGLHHRMVERIAQSKRTSARLGLTGRVEATPVPKSPYPNSPRVGGNLTPAGQRLLSKIGGGRRTDDAVAAFNRSGNGPRHPTKGSRRARLREQRSIYG